MHVEMSVCQQPCNYLPTKLQTESRNPDCGAEPSISSMTRLNKSGYNDCTYLCSLGEYLHSDIRYKVKCLANNDIYKQINFTLNSRIIYISMCKIHGASTINIHVTDIQNKHSMKLIVCQHKFLNRKSFPYFRKLQ